MTLSGRDMNRGERDYLVSDLSRGNDIEPDDLLASCLLNAQSLEERSVALAQTNFHKIEFDKKISKRRFEAWKKYDAFIKNNDRFQRRIKEQKISSPIFLKILGADVNSLYVDKSEPDWIRSVIKNNQYQDSSFLSKKIQEYDERGIISVFYPQVKFFADLLFVKIQFNSKKLLWLQQPELLTDAFLDSFIAILEQNVRRAVVLEINSLSMLGELHSRTPSERFNDYRKLTRDINYRRKFLGKYPVLSRYVNTALQMWLDSSVELLDRLKEDSNEIVSKFDISFDDVLMGVNGSGDTHASGRAVSKLVFKSGKCLVYKPRNLAIDVCFQELLSWFNTECPSIQHRILKILERSNHGWVEYVPPVACEEDDHFEAFYVRLGSLLCILHMLCAVDVHFENLVAHREFPVVIDL
jgi:lantibiotic modifying enzyme